MTAEFISPDVTAWASALTELTATRGESAHDRVRRAEEVLLDLAAPSLSAVVEKLMIIWKDDTWGEDDTACRLRTVIGDLRRLEAARG